MLTHTHPLRQVQHPPTLPLGDSAPLPRNTNSRYVPPPPVSPSRLRIPARASEEGEGRRRGSIKHEDGVITNLPRFPKKDRFRHMYMHIRAHIRETDARCRDLPSTAVTSRHALTLNLKTYGPWFRITHNLVTNAFPNCVASIGLRKLKKKTTRWPHVRCHR